MERKRAMVRNGEEGIRKGKGKVELQRGGGRQRRTKKKRKIIENKGRETGKRNLVRG